MLRENYAFDSDKPNFQVRLFKWAYGKDEPFYWRSVLVALGFAVAIGATLYLVGGLSYEQFLLIVNNAFVSILIVSVCLVLGVGILLSTQNFIIRYFWEYSTIKGMNEDAKSIKYTLKVIKHSRKWVVLYDYGEKEEDNIYSNTKVQAALLAKLNASNSDFKLSMIFKKDRQEVDKLPLIQALKQWQQDNKVSAKQVEIICGQDRAANEYAVYNQECKEFPDHYKINDNSYAYLSAHAERAASREFVYFKPALGWYSARVRNCLHFHNAVIANS